MEEERPTSAAPLALDAAAMAAAVMLMLARVQFIAAASGTASGIKYASPSCSLLTSTADAIAA